MNAKTRKIEIELPATMTAKVAGDTHVIATSAWTPEFMMWNIQGNLEVLIQRVAANKATEAERAAARKAKAESLGRGETDMKGAASPRTGIKNLVKSLKDAKGNSIPKESWDAVTDTLLVAEPAAIPVEIRDAVLAYRGMATATTDLAALLAMTKK